ncbi:C1GALT1-specific chaperone 1-like protein [Coccinella septempunctata]|uniref:C1GALT1-specific chaperone 1-like protein n=1 Tax=Coccinella septempunctata TaxID=41139 RepID=UPI001D091E8C|nr:C1GALT1-specific chaperone 1-like protein [Coccinella septempunctata]
MWCMNSHIIFTFGFLSGTIISILFQSKKQLFFKDNDSYNQGITFKPLYARKYSSFDLLRYGNHNFITESEYLFQSIKILCLIFVFKDKNFESIENTWGKHCNALEKLYIDKTRSIFPSKSNARANSWILFCEKVKKTPEYYNWLLVVNDDTYVIMDNLRYYLANKNSSENFYLGHPVKFWNTHYNLGRAGYVMSKGVIAKMQISTCDNDISYRNKEDYLLGNYLKKLNISVMDTKDDFGLSLFHPYNLNRILFPVENHKFQSVYEAKCCSRNTITFNAMEASKMYTYHYLLYTLQLFYEGHLGNRKPEKPPDELVWQKFLKDQNLPLNITNEEYYNAWDKLIDSPDAFGRNMKREDYSDME